MKSNWALGQGCVVQRKDGTWVPQEVIKDVSQQEMTMKRTIKEELQSKITSSRSGTELGYEVEQRSGKLYTDANKLLSSGAAQHHMEMSDKLQEAERTLSDNMFKLLDKLQKEVTELNAKVVTPHDVVVVRMLTELLEMNPWPSSDARQLILEQWSKDFTRQHGAPHAKETN